MKKANFCIEPRRFQFVASSSFSKDLCLPLGILCHVTQMASDDWLFWEPLLPHSKNNYFFLKEQRDEGVFPLMPSEQRFMDAFFVSIFLCTSGMQIKGCPENSIDETESNL
ncbi:hypothetical protein CDAR_381171 [Caerostris darwini]|uniref:Uncharacterized protein n=1 Tax=Caerostris darwini TaxID=1538125 RepID=A0AAV4W5M2_9ARAC|nr:hypothetical protein CDAR_381171 [Caerostris darwini]